VKEREEKRRHIRKLCTTDSSKNVPLRSVLARSKYMPHKVGLGMSPEKAPGKGGRKAKNV